MAETITETILEAIGNWIADIISRVSAWLWDNFKPVFEAISSWLATVFGKLGDVLDRMYQWFNDVMVKIANFLENLIEQAINYLKGIYNKVADAIESLFKTVTSFISDTFNIVVEEILGVVDSVKNWIIDAYESIANGIRTIVESVTAWLGDLFGSIKLGIENIIVSASEVVDAVVRAIKDFISSVVDVVGGALRDLLETIASLPDALASLGEGFAEAVEKFIGKPLSDIPANLWEAFTDNFKLLNEGDQQRLIGVMSETYLSPNSPPKNNEELREMFNKLIPEQGIMRGIFLTIFGVLATMLSIAGITSAASQVMVQEFGITSPYAILQPGDAIRANHFGLVDDTETAMTLRRHGHSIADADTLIKIGKIAPPEIEAISFWKRGIYTEEKLDQVFDKKGWTIEDRDAMKKASEIIPPVQDLIMMAVRDVFTPEIAERFGQLEDPPEGFKEWGAKLGLSDFWVRNYWGAHWTLPSARMGFEMLHRRVIGEEDMNLLLKAADVMPFWREKIIDISYSPFTRVDIRRMHKTEVLTEAEVFEAYQDIGYNEEKAGKLTDFTLELNAPKTADDEVELLELTRSSVLNFYADGLLDRDDAHERLTDMGLSEEATVLYLTAIDMEEQRTLRKVESDLILAKEKAGLIDFDKAQDALSEIGLERRELDKVMAKLITQATVKTRLPAKGDLDKMVGKQIISQVVYTDTLKLLGYSEVWATRLTQLLTG